MVYLIHFDEPYKGTQHYLGYVESVRGKLKRRIEKHKNSTGAKLLKAVNEAGIGWDVVRTWPEQEANRNFERRIKNGKNMKACCPKCNPKNYKKIYTDPLKHNSPVPHVSAYSNNF